MSRRRLKRKNNIEIYESSGEFKGMRDTQFSRVFKSMLYGRNFKTLKNRQKLLYIYLKGMRYGGIKPQNLYPDIEAFKGEDKFFFGFDDAQETGIYTRNMKKEFYMDIKELEKFGFIKIISQGNFGKKTIYQYSDSWYRDKLRVGNS